MSALVIALALQAASPTWVPPPPSTRAAAPRPATAAQEADVVVTGYRMRRDIETKVVPPAGGVIGIRQGFEWSSVLARCAARDRLKGLKWLRGTVDGKFQTTEQAAAQDRLKRLYITCSENPEWLARMSAPPRVARTSNASGIERDFADGPVNVNSDTNNLPDVAALGRNIYDRGAFTIEAMKRFAPDLELTRADTLDPAVQDRFNVRETARNRFRLPADYRYFEVAVCMVREEPKLAVALAMSDGPARFDDLQAALIDRARMCVGGAQKVTVDPTEFRIYIADAVYRWAIAARDVDSLIPKDRTSTRARISGPPRTTSS